MKLLFRRGLAFLLVIIILTGLSGCSLFQKAAINGIPVKAFTIVYSDDQPDYTLRAAEYIQSQILSRTGAEVAICEDDSGNYEHEILVGNTNRPLSDTVRSDARNMEFHLTADENHIAINGEYFIIAAAAYYFVETYIPGEKFKSTIPAGEVITAAPITTAPNHFIYLIGDGMGFNQTNMFSYMSLAEQESYHDGEDVFYGYYLPYQGQLHTDSLSGTTDSAAGATALACGFKTINGHVGKDENLNDVQSLTELAISLNMGTAIMSTDKQSGATPGGFSAHVDSRNSSTDIIKLQGKLMVDHGTLFKCGLSSTRSCENAVNEVLTTLDQQDQFFIMYEEGYIDKNCHNQDAVSTFECMVRFNQVIGLFMEYAFYHPDTLVLITADHETGGLYFDENGKPGYVYDDHTSANVPFFAYGQGAEVFDGFDGENNLIPQYIAAMWGIETFGDGTLAAGN